MKKTFGLRSLLTVESNMWISITAGGFECKELNQFLSRCSCSCSIAMSVRLSVRPTRALWQNESNFCQYYYTVWKVDSCSFTTRI